MALKLTIQVWKIYIFLNYVKRMLVTLRIFMIKVKAKCLKMHGSSICQKMGAMDIHQSTNCTIII